uniref:Uncharacterized protein n=1 Tax=Caudovirales sp. ctU7I6 TaxID=2826776 RepID=A0A8S5QK72_9CAUD|nr:MAG TPA: hypothetical protein [Caudovirales sp. ctU7I6]
MVSPISFRPNGIKNIIHIAVKHVNVQFSQHINVFFVQVAKNTS